MENSEKKIKQTLCDGCVLLGMVIFISSLAQPLVTQAVSNKKLYGLVDNLEAVRSGIRMFKAEHGLLPSQQFPGDRSITAKEFITALATWPAEDNKLYRRSFPANPYVTDSAAANQITIVSDPNAELMGTESTGWWFKAATGDFRACDSKFHMNY